LEWSERTRRGNEATERHYAARARFIQEARKVLSSPDRPRPRPRGSQFRPGGG
jgi:hypothetical protein